MTLSEKLKAIRDRRLIAELCRKTKHSRTWYYKVLSGASSCAAELPIIDNLLELSTLENAIGKLRQRAGVNQSELGDRLGVSRMTVYVWERHPTVERIARVSGVLGLT